MPSTVQVGSLGRWFEELCRIGYPRLRDLAVDDGTSLRPKALPKNGGVYVFWWTGSHELLCQVACNRDLTLVGPGGRPVHLNLDNEWLGISTRLPIPMYGGKTAESVAKRVGQHLRLSQARMLPMGGGAIKARRPTTSCQLRAGIEHLFPNEADSRSLTLDNVGLSLVELSGDDNAANRFYLEDLAVGLMRPPLNVDIER
jgi:hypothetical protein